MNLIILVPSASMESMEIEKRLQEIIGSGVPNRYLAVFKEKSGKSRSLHVLTDQDLDLSNWTGKVKKLTVTDKEKLYLYLCQNNKLVS